ncbi:MAG: hypothetical protein ABSH13_18665 [Candidatus Acidiferrum sp.]|jgi:hypothetical protein
MPALQILALLLCLVVVVTPILAILAFTRVQKLAEQVQAARLNELIARVYPWNNASRVIEKDNLRPNRSSQIPKRYPRCRRAFHIGRL